MFVKDIQWKIKGILEVKRYPKGALKMFSWPIKWCL